MLELAALSIFGFWGIIFLLVVFAILVFFSENDAFATSTMTIIVAAVMAQVFFDVPVWASIVNNPLLVVVFGVLYIAAGVAYTCIWAFPDYIRSQSTKIDDRYNTWKRVDAKSDESFETFVESKSYTEMYGATRNKARLSTWTMLWPFSLTWVLARRPAMWAWDEAYRQLGTTFDKIGKGAATRAHKNRK